eukprot:3630104-Prymnesium_polylepis.1
MRAPPRSGVLYRSTCPPAAARRWKPSSCPAAHSSLCSRLPRSPRPRRQHRDQLDGWRVL